MSNFSLPLPLERLADSLASLPGVGPKSATKLAVFLNTTGKGKAGKLQSAIKEALETIVTCQECGNLSVEELCTICGDQKRVNSMLMVVESSTDLLQVEQAGAYEGRYLVLGGLISPINGISPDQLRFDYLDKYLETYHPQELILALSSTLEGEATVLYIKSHIRPRFPDISVTRFAKGLPTGVNIEYLDKTTISGALAGRILV